ncbi:MAG TPA: heavy-metal-associated domain-containing protein [Microlunatus sp.]|nr:heavy-metal-associated domain-containing protein [Microlunatus sp.]
MSTPVRLLAFAGALVAVFILALAGARTVLPADLAQAGPGRTGHTTNPSEKDTEMDHNPAPTPTAQHSEDSHNDHGQVSAADPVRGLSVAQDGYQLTGLRAPRPVGEEGALSFRLTGPDGRPVTHYTTAHDKDLHLIVVRSDGSRFRHVHPSLAGDGTWSLPWRWAAAGTYRVFADFIPAASGETLTLTSTFDVAGGLDPAPPSGDTTTDHIDGLTVALEGSLRSSTESTLRFTVTRDGQPVNLQPYLGAAGHLVALRVGDLAYLHVHPIDGPSLSAEVAFMAQAPTPGRYLLYLDFQVDEQVYTATFTTTASR